MSASSSVRKGAWAAIVALLLIVAVSLTYQFVLKGTNNGFMSNTKIGKPFDLIDHNGNAITEAVLSGKPSAVFFGFTHCPEVCPTTLYELSGWLDALGEDGKDINSFFITVDPERDSPEVMKSYVENFTDRIIGITGNPDEIFKLAKSWHVYWKKVPLDDGDYTLDHTASIFLVDAKGNFKSTIAFRENGETAMQKLRNLVKN
ncbi:SCO family protein [Lentilitoribacter sp. EG35]|uniref:SCO family protein n=1 Tax=Lentilitoribacter sp. EG35 TaxID=3234192 RepID=UPI0034609E6D